MKLNRSRLITYLRVGYLLHLITLLEVIVLVFLFYFLHINTWAAERNIFLKSFVLLYFGLMPLFPALDAWSRYQNYKQVKDKLYLHGFQPRIINPFLKSGCQRCAVLVAA